MPRKRRGKKRVINWGPVLVLATIVNIVLGALYSPLTSVTKVRVTGAKPYDVPRITAALTPLQNIPYKRVPAKSVESDILYSPAVKTAEFRHNLFGRGLLTVTYRTPVARLRSEPPLYLDGDGVVFSDPNPPPDLREVALEANMLKPNLTFSMVWPSKQIAALGKKLDNIPRLKGMVLYLDARGRLWLNRNGSGRVELGGTDALDEKLSQLQKLLVQRPTLLEEVKSLSLTDPKRPAIIPLARTR